MDDDAEHAGTDGLAGYDAAFADDRFVRALARRVVRDAAEADDVAQDAWLEALKRRPDARPSLKAWFARVVAHLASNRARGDRRRDDRERRAARPEAREPEQELLEREEVRRKLVAAVLSLGKPQSTVLVLRYFDDLPPRAIAQRLGLPVETVRTHLKRGAQRLRERLGDERGPGGARVLALLPILLPRSDAASALAGAALVTAKAKLALTLAVVVVAAGGFYVATRPAAATAPPPPPIVGAKSAEPEPPRRIEVPASTPVARAPFKESAESAPTPTSAPAPDSAATCVVRGVVQDVAGKPVPECDVYLGDAATGAPVYEADLLDFLAKTAAANPDAVPPRRVGRTDGWPRLLKTDAQGRFEVSGFPPTETGDVAAAHPTLGVTVATGFTARAGAATDVVLTFKRAFVLYGRVTDEKGEGVAETNVSIMGEREEGRWTYVMSVRTTDHGDYRTPPLSRLGFNAQVQREGYKFARRHIDGFAPDETSREVNFALEPAPHLGGGLVLASGEKAELGRRLRELDLDRQTFDPALIGSHDDPATTANFRDIGRDEGKIDLAADAWTLRPQDGVPVYVSLWVGKTLIVREETRGRLNFDLVVDPAKLPRPIPKGTLFVQVVDEDGKAVQPDRLQFDQRFPARGRFFDFVVAFLPFSNGGNEARDVPVGRYLLEVGAPGFARSLVEVEVRPGPARSETKVVLRRPTSKLSVRLRDADGAPLAGARLYLLDDALHPLPSSTQATSNAEGRATFVGLAPGDYVVCAEPALETLPPASRRVRVSGDATTTTLDLAPSVEVTVDPEGSSGPFTFRYLAEDGTPLFDGASNGSRTYCDESHVRLPKGRVTIEVRCPGFEVATATVDVKDGLTVKMPLVKAAE